MPHVEQIAGRLQRASEVVHMQAAAVLAEVAIQCHHREMVIREALQQLRVLGFAGAEHQAVDAAAPEQFDQRLLLARIVVGVGQEQCVASRLQPCLDSRDHPRVERVREVGDEQADHARGACAHALRDGIGLVAQLLGGTRHRSDRTPAHRAAAVQRARGRAERHAGGLRHVADRGLLLLLHSGTAAWASPAGKRREPVSSGTAVLFRKKAAM